MNIFASSANVKMNVQAWKQTVQMFFQYSDVLIYYHFFTPNISSKILAYFDKQNSRSL